MKTRIASVLLSVGLMSAGFFALRPDKVTDPPRPPQSFMPGVPASQTVVAAAPLAASNIPVEEQDRTDCGVTSSGQAIPWDQLGAKAGQQYSGNGLGVIPTATGATVRCIFQKMEGNATPEGLWLTSTADDSLGERFRVRAMAIGRADTLVRLSNEGEVQVRDGTAAYLRRGLTEEYSATMDGVRQDFLIAAAPAGEGALRLMLDVTGASGATAADGATLTLDGSGRAIAYSRLRVTDATGRELTARMEAPCGQLAVVVEDTNAAYPIRIDPTFSDANWVSMNPSISGPSGLVQACVADASGSLYIGGDFRCAGSVNAYYIAKWNGSTWSALGSGVNSIVYALALDGSGNLYAAGSFTTADGLPANRIAKWNGSTWSALGSGMDSTVRALALDGSGNLYAAGSFTTADGLPANRIAKWNGSTWAALGSGMVSDVYALALDGSGNLYAGGYFTTAGGVAANRIAKWNGSIWSALGSGMNSTVRALALDGSGNLYAAGDFTTAGGVAANRIAKWNGSAWSAQGSGTDNITQALALDANGNLYAGGKFTTAGGIVVSYIAKWNGSEWSALGLGLGVNGLIKALVLDDNGNLYAGGSFTIAGGVVVNGIAKWNGSTWSALGSGVSYSVYALALDGSGNLYAGGNFITAGGVAANRIAKWNGSTWSALGSGMDSNVNALAVDGSGNLYAAGDFTTAGGVAAKNIAKWDGSTWSALGWTSTLGVNALLLGGDGYLYAGGGGTIRKWNGSSWRDLGSAMYGTGAVNALAMDGSGNLYAGGSFTTVGGVTANRIALWNGSTWLALGSGVNSTVYALAVDGNANLYAGGSFTTAGGLAARGIAQWDGATWSNLGSGVYGIQVNALVLDGNGVLYAGGDFSTAGGNFSAFLAKALLVAPQIAIEQPAGTGLVSGVSTTNFGPVTPGASSGPVTYIVRNTGDGELTIGSVSVVGSAANEFIINTSGMAATVGVNGSTTFTVTFSPHARSIRWASLRISSNAVFQDLFEVSLTGGVFVPSYLLSYQAGGGGSITGVSQQSVFSGDDGTEVNALPDPGYGFVQWSDGLLTATRTDTNVTANLTVTAEFVAIPPTITTATPLPAVIVGNAYTLNLTASGGATPYHWSAPSGGLPGWLDLAEDGTLSGTPDTLGTTTFTIQATGGNGASSTMDFTLTVKPVPVPPSILTTSPLPTGVVGAAYTLTLAASGGVTPYHWSVPGGGLPGGLDLSEDGVISGTPDTVGDFTFTVLVIGDDDGSSAMDFSLAVKPTPVEPSIATESPLPPGKCGVAYSHVLTANGGTPPYSWIVSEGSLPDGLNLLKDGTLTGTPGTGGTATFIVQVTGSDEGSATKEFSLSIDPAPIITTDSWLETVISTDSYTRLLTATGGVPPYVWSINPGSYPPNGLNLSQNGTLSGRVDFQDTVIFTVRVTGNDGASSTKDFRISAMSPPAFIDTKSPLPPGRVGAAYYQSLAASLWHGAWPYKWSAGPRNLPSGLSLSRNGVISGTPETGGTFTFDVRVDDAVSFCWAWKEFSLTIVQDQPVLTSADAASGRKNVDFSYQISATQYPTSYGATNLPSGLTVDPATGLISGKPTVTGAFVVTLSAQNIIGTGQHALTLVIESPLPLPVITSPPFASATGNAPFEFQLAASNSAQTFEIRNGPAWLGVNESTGLLEGTPTVPGTVTVQVRASNTTGAGAWSTLSISVAPNPDAPVVTSLAEARGRKKDSFSFQLTASPAATSYVIAGSLPSGILFTATSGLLDGTPTVEGIFNLTITASNAAGQGVATPLKIVLGPARQVPVITNATSFTANVGATFATTVLATNTPTSFTFDNLPAGLVQSGATGRISGTLDTPGNFTFAVTAANADGTSAPQTMVLRVQYNANAPAVSALSGSSGYVGVPFSYQIITSKAATSFTVNSLPDGLTVNPATGVISGTPTTAGSFEATLQATNTAGIGEPRTLTFVIEPKPDTPEITGSLLEETTALAVFSYQIQTRSVLPVIGYTISGLPDGISANTSTGLLSGAATITGVFDVKLRASNLIGVGPEQILRIKVRGGSLVPKITSAASVAAPQGAALVYQITASNPPILAWQAEPLPDGLSLDSAAGRIIGKPVVPGTYQVILRASNVNGAGDPMTLQIQVKPNLAAPVVMIPDYFFISTSQPIETEIQVLNMPSTRPWGGGVGVFADGLPAGVTMNSATGILSGQPFSTAGNSWAVGFYAVNESGRGATVMATLYYFQNCGITITGPKQLSATSGQALNFNVGTNVACSYYYCLLDYYYDNYHYDYWDYWYSNGGSGFSIPASRLPLPGNHRYLLEVYSEYSNGWQRWGLLDGLTLNVAPAPGAPVIQSPSPIYCTAGTPIATGLSASGVPTRYEVTHMSPAWPSGLVFNSSTGAFSGTVAQAGVVSFLARAYNATGAGLPKEISMVFSAPTGAPAITTGGALLFNSGRLMQLSAAGDSTVSFSPRLMSQQPPLTGTVGVAFSHQFQATGTVIRYGITGLPDGLVYNENTGAVSGEPAKPGAFELTVTPIGTTVSGQPVTISLQIAPATGTPAMTSLATAAAAVGTAFNWQFTASAGPNGYNLGELPDWLALNPVTGSLTGTPTVPGDTKLSVSAYNALGEGQAQEFTIHAAAAAGTPVVNPPAGNLTGRVGVAFNATLSATGTVDFYDATALPFGISLDSLTGVFSGTPVEPGTQVVQVWGVNAQGIGEPRSVTMVIAPAVGAPAFVGETVLRLLEGQPLQHTFGTAPTATAYAADGLPSGWSFSTASGLLQATPLAGNYELQIEAWNVAGTSGKQPFEIRVFASSGALWQDEKFGAQVGNPAVAGWDADPDQDGISNTLERALALEPMTADSSLLPTAKQQGGYLTFTYRQNKDATDLTFTPQVSSSLMSNSWSADGLTETERLDKGGYWLVTIRDSTPLTSTPRRFMRLQVIMR